MPRALPLFLFTVLTSSSLFAAERIQVHGHRGARARRPENTIPAFQFAIDAGVDALESDMAVTKDGVIVMSHDPVLEPPVCSGPLPSAVIHQLMLRQVKEWDCGATRNPKFPNQQPMPGTRIPTLDELLNLAGQGTFDFNIETKSFPDKPELTPDPKTFARMVLKKVYEHKLEKRVILQSFDFRTLRAMHKLNPRIRLAALTESDPRDFVAIAKEAEAGIISPHFSLVTPDKVSAAHTAGSQVVVWTANTPDIWDKMIDAKVDAIISDDPAELIRYLRGRDLNSPGRKP
jgi:glycerophosphoryl diester phosphodiesterase